MLQDLAAGSDMGSSSHSPSEEIPTSGEDYQLFPKDNLDLSVMSSPSPSLPAGYRSLSQIMTVVTSMAISTPSMRLIIPLLWMYPRTPITSSPQVTSVTVRPTVYVASSTPAVTTQSVRTTSLPKDIYIASAMLENISPDEYQLPLQ